MRAFANLTLCSPKKNVFLFVCRPLPSMQFNRLWIFMKKMIEKKNPFYTRNSFRPYFFYYYLFARHIINCVVLFVGFWKLKQTNNIQLSSLTPTYPYIPIKFFFIARPENKTHIFFLIFFLIKWILEPFIIVSFMTSYFFFSDTINHLLIKMKKKNAFFNK